MNKINISTPSLLKPCKTPDFLGETPKDPVRAIKKSVYANIILRTKKQFQKLGEDYSPDKLITSKRTEFYGNLERKVEKTAQSLLCKGVPVCSLEEQLQNSLEEQLQMGSLYLSVCPQDFISYDPEKIAALPPNKKASLLSSLAANASYKNTNQAEPSIPEDFVTPLLKDLIIKCMLKNAAYKVSDIRISDLDQDFVPALKVEMGDNCKKKFYRQLISITTENFQRGDKSYSIETLIPQKKDEFYKKVDKATILFANKYIDGFFNKNLSFGKWQESPILQSIDFVAYPNDFTNFDPKTALNSFDVRSERAINQTEKLRKKLSVKKATQSFNAQMKNSQDSLSVKEILMLYKLASETFNINISEVSTEHAISVKDKFLKLLEKQSRIDKEKLAAELIAKKPQASASPAKKKVSKKAKNHHVPPSHPPTAVVDDEKIDIKNEEKESTILSRMVFSLNTTVTKSFSLHSRVSRWGTNDLNHIKNFGPSYKKANSKQLKYMKNCHNLAGIERILSKEELRKKYSFAYTIKNNIGAEGRGFYATMDYPNANSESGIVYVAFNKASGVVYHAMFVPISAQISIKELKDTMCDEAHGMTAEDENSNSMWDNVAKVSFHLGQDDKINMQIGENPKDRVNFSFEPLDLEA